MKNVYRRSIRVSLGLITAALPLTIEAQEEDETIYELTPFTVEEGGNAGYGAVSLSSGRLAEKYIDTPQLTSVVTSELLQDARLTSSFTAFKYVPNVVSTDSGHSPAISMRGLKTGEIFVDGVSLSGGGIIIDTAFFDRIEVVKGPVGASYGRGNPAGFMNYITKNPLYTNSTEIQTSVGTGGPKNNFRTVFDNNGFVTKDGKTAYRFVASYDTGSTTKEGTEFERSGMLLSVDHQLQKGNIRVNFQNFDNKNPGIVGTNLSDEVTYEQFLEAVAYDDLLSYTNFPDADKSWIPLGIAYTNKGINANVVLNYNISEKFSTRQALNFNDQRRDGFWTGPVAELITYDDEGEALGSAFVFKVPNDTRNWVYQSDFVWENEGEFMDTKILFGGDVNFSESEGAFGIVNTTPTRLFPFNPAEATWSFAGDFDSNGSRRNTDGWSGYVELRSSFMDDRIRTSISQRKLGFDSESISLASGVKSFDKDTTPLFGTYSVLFKATDSLSVYATAAQHQEAPSFVNEFTGLPVEDPRSSRMLVSQPTTDLLEFGVKGSLFNGKGFYAISTFEIETGGNIARALVPGEFLPDGTTLHVFQGFKNIKKIKGWEFEAYGQIGPRLTAMIGGGFLSGTTTIPHYALPQILNLGVHPGDSISGHLRYSFGPEDDANEGLQVTLGAKALLSGWSVWQGSNHRFTGELTYPSSEMLVDLGLSYGFGDGKYRLGAQVTNAFHEQASVHTFGNQNVESGRLFFVNFGAKF